jgi:hypothetical protein
VSPAILIMIPFAVLTLEPAIAEASPPSSGLMAELAKSAANFERMRTHASYALEGRMETVDGDGEVSSWKAIVARVEADGSEARFLVDRYVEDGDDKTAEARAKALERARERRRDPDKRKEIHMPTLASEQPRYAFDVVEVDRVDPSRVKLSFVPKVKTDTTVEGTAWIDTRRGAVLTAGFKLARTSMFVNYVHVTLVFGEETPLGPAVSKVSFEGEGGVLFFRKHVRGTATLSRYRILP